VAVAPDLLEQHLAGEDLPRLAGQRHQQVELERGERDRLAVALDRVAGHVDGQVADLEQLRRRFLAAPKAGPDARDELLGLERLDHVVVRAGLQAHDDVDGVGLGGEHDDRDAGLGADRAADVDAVGAGQHQVEQHEVRLVLAEHGERLVAVGAQGRLVALAAQDDAEHLGQGGVVVDDQHAALHAVTHPRSPSCARRRALHPSCAHRDMEPPGSSVTVTARGRRSA
jgi:hypothetical protein